jgi:hypothetical protein
MQVTINSDYTSTYTISGLDPGRHYIYRLVPYGVSDDSRFSEGSFTTPGAVQPCGPWPPVFTGPPPKPPCTEPKGCGVPPPTLFSDDAVALSLDGPSPITQGDTPTLVVSASDAGLSGAQLVHVIVTLPAGVEVSGPIQRDRGPGCTGSTELDCDLDFLNAGMTSTLRIPLKVTGASPVDVTARITQLQPEQHYDNNTATLTIPVGVEPPAPAPLAPAASGSSAQDGSTGQVEKASSTAMLELTAVDTRAEKARLEAEAKAKAAEAAAAKAAADAKVAAAAAAAAKAKAEDAVRNGASAEERARAAAAAKTAAAAADKARHAAAAKASAVVKAKAAAAAKTKAAAVAREKVATAAGSSK